MPAIWEYPPDIMEELQTPLPIERREAAREELRVRHEATLARIDVRIRGEQELAAERRMALEWCRANGNPHRKDEA